jgi:hypothetical protein
MKCFLLKQNIINDDAEFTEKKTDTLIHSPNGNPFSGSWSTVYHTMGF